MKIAVCLPSLNEAHNIQKITRIVDLGLTTFVSTHTDFEAVIVNVDSNSSDDTVKLFNEVGTMHPKYSIVVREAGGKGKNILEFCRYVLSGNIDLCLTIDTDIISADPEWVTRLLTPLLEENAVYVTPVYGRSRFEGSSTNHFAFPFVYAFSGRALRQPIAGDFAFSRKLARAIADSDLVNNESIQKYGIDIFMTLMAISTGDHIAQVSLGKKLHAPSFNKLEYMFPQIAAAALLSSEKVIINNEMSEDIGSNSNILPNLDFSHKKAAKAMRDKALISLESQNKLDWADEALVARFVEAASSRTFDETKMAFAWVGILSVWARYFLALSLTTAEAERAGQELLPFFVLRATNFWLWAETVEVADVEKAIKHQAESLRDKIQTT